MGGAGWPGAGSPGGTGSEFRPQTHEDSSARRRVEVGNVGEDVPGRLVLEVGQVLRANFESQRLRIERARPREAREIERDRCIQERMRLDEFVLVSRRRSE